METNITIEQLIGGVATFNADPYCIENEEMAQEIIDTINDWGCRLVSEDEIGEAKSKLDIREDDNSWNIYKAGIDCLFAIRKQDSGVIKVEVDPKFPQFMSASNGELVAQCSLFEDQAHCTYDECVEQFQTAVNVCGFDEKAIQRHMDINKVECAIEVYTL